MFGLTYFRIFFSFRIFVTSSFRNCHKMFPTSFKKIGANFVMSFSCQKFWNFKNKNKKRWFFRMMSSLFMQNFRYLVSKTKKMKEGEHFWVTLCPPWIRNRNVSPALHEVVYVLLELVLRAQSDDLFKVMYVPYDEDF